MQNPGPGRKDPALSISASLRGLAEAPVVCAVLSMEEDHPGTFHLVGGVVRDLALGPGSTRPADLDFVVAPVEGGTPAESVRKAAERAAEMLGGTAFVLDRKAPSYRVVASVRGAASTLDFSPLKGDIHSDLLARDFTVNSMAVPLSSLRAGEPEIIDPSSGLDDVRSRTLRATSAGAFDEDPLRCVRAVRLAQQYRLALDPGTRGLVKDRAHLVKRAAVERIRDELLIVFREPGAPEGLRALFDLGLAGHVLPEITGWEDVQGYPLLEHSLKVLAEAERLADEVESGALFPDFSERLAAQLDGPLGPVSKKTVLKIAAFLHDAGKPPTIDRREGRLRFLGHDREGAKAVKNLLKRLKLPRRVVAGVVLLVRNHHRVFTFAKLERPTARARAHLFRKMGGEAGVGLVLLSIADARATRGGEDPALIETSRDLLGFYYGVYSAQKPRPVMDGRDVMETFGVEEGPVVGEIMDRISEGVESGEVSTREDAVEYVRRWLGSGGDSP